MKHYVVPENIYTPTTERKRNSEGVGGSKAQEIPEKMEVNVINEITFSDLLHTQIVAWVFATQPCYILNRSSILLLQAHWNLTTSQKSSMLFRSFVVLFP